ncbi:tRNA methyl transferase-like protein [Flavobacterium alkalisoli]|uniref:7-cyano-7-deazaguanine synthase n=1 Tax=Flavobacterium alkalisoli TaxID=2602769 RepID=A0A5B9FWR7_9FLAO|nr:7-cyano-7-deazaguanine synthase [Flavobacterium alkalisoli]QEE49117.1 tRNA methyl transferase-like protein [Flavobacterium alkalisoli]
MKDYVLILASGGIDSTACIQFYKNLDFNIETLFIDYGQVSKYQELKAVKLITDFYNIKLRVIKINITKKEIGEITGRNAFFIFTALMSFYNDRGLIALGIHYGTSYYDCSTDFVNNVQKIIDKYSGETIKISAPFIKFNKKEIYEYCSLEKVPIHLCYSCELGKKQPCGQCLTCKDLELIYASTNK